MARRHLYLGSYTQGPEQGIPYGSLDDESGEMQLTAELGGIANPSFVIPDTSGRFLYAVAEVGRLDAHPGGGAAAAGRDLDTGALVLLGLEGTGGKAPCHLALSHDGHHLYTVSYSSGVVSTHRIGEDGRVGGIVQQIAHEGSGPHRRQDKPHAHGLWVTRDDRFVLACDLGTDEVIVYRRDATTGELARHDVWVPSPGGGPRHVAFDPEERHCYAVQELDNTLAVAAWDAERGSLDPLQVLGTLPDDFAGESKTAEVACSADGRFVYVSNRGHDSLAVFARDGATGKLAAVGHVSTQGDHPRHFCLVSDSDLLLCANQNSGDVVSFRIGSDGMPVPTGHRLEARKPVCIVVL